MIVLWLIVTALCDYRVQRIITTDDWPPSEWFRYQIAVHFGPESSWYTMFTCPWCFGFWSTLAVTALIHRFVVDLITGQIHNRWGLVAVLGFAFSTVVGLIAETESLLFTTKEELKADD